MSNSNILASTSIIGDKVKNFEGVDLGKVKELLLNAESGKIEYGVISHGGIAGIGAKDIAVPYEAFTLQKEDDFFILNVDKETLDNAHSKIEYNGKDYFIY